MPAPPHRTRLSLPSLKAEASTFAAIQTARTEPSLYGVTDGKAVGTFVEHGFREYLAKKYEWNVGNSAKGIDFPDLDIDMKVTSIKQPQSSCPFKAARQKVFGLGYSLLVFVYEKIDDPRTKSARLNILHVVFVQKEATADYQTTAGIRKILENGGNRDDLLAFMEERMLPLDEIGATALADEILATPPVLGYLTISNALQWRLQYGRVIEKAGAVPGLERLV